MLVYLNGRIVPEEQAVVSIFDRGFLYGDGVFETVRVYGGQPFLWEEHTERMMAGARFLQIAVPLSAGEIRRVLRELLERNRMSEGIARITLSRGPGPRGYSPRGAIDPVFVMSLHHPPEQLPDAYRVILASIRCFSRDPLAQYKHSSKLTQIRARMEADAVGADEALLMNEHGHVVEGTACNLFWIEDRTICTAPFSEGILPGTTRKYVMRLAREHAIPVKEKAITAKELVHADGVFLSGSAIEIKEVVMIDEAVVSRSRLTSLVKALYPHGIGR